MVQELASIDTGDAIAHCLSFDKSTKSIAVGCSDAEIKVINIEKGEIFSENNLEVRGPAKGLSPQFFYKIQGKKSNRSIKKDSYLQSDDL